MLETNVPETTAEDTTTVVTNFFELKWATFIKLLDKIYKFFESLFKR